MIHKNALRTFRGLASGGTLLYFPMQKVTLAAIENKTMWLRNTFWLGVHVGVHRTMLCPRYGSTGATKGVYHGCVVEFTLRTWLYIHSEESRGRSGGEC